MGLIVSFENYLPPARFDDEPWTEAQIDEAPEATGPWTTIDTIELDPVDDDPTSPQLRSFTTPNGTALNLWYRVIFLDGDANESQPTEAVQNAPPTDTSRDLCTLADVLGYVPGYQVEQPTDTKLQALITSESRSIHQETGREFRPIGGADTRYFLLVHTCRSGVVRIGDATEVEEVTLLDEWRADVGEVDVMQIVTLPSEREEWEPIRRLRFLPGSTILRPGYTLRVTGTWGFPAIPADIREACAKRVILRYLTDVAAAGTAFADAIRESDINFAALFASAQQVVENYADPLIA